MVFAHGSGSSRHSPRNRFVAEVLNRAGLGTMLFDLLTTEEERDRGNVFDIELLGERLTEVTRWLAARPDMDNVRLGYFGASTGAAAALWASTDPGVDVAAVVSRGGRPDLAGPRLAGVTVPTLLVVGGRDHSVLELNRQAQESLGGESRLVVVPGATHLFEEPGALDRVAELAARWFTHHLAGARRRPGGKSTTSEPDPLLERAREQASGSTFYSDPFADEVMLAAREEAEGVELFADPDEAIPAGALKEGAPGHETLVADQIGLGPNAGEEEGRADEDEWEES